MHCKVLLVGDSNVGKTTYVNYLLTNKLTKNHEPTFGVDIYSYVFNTNYGQITFDFWDCAGLYKNRGIGPGYYICSHGAIIMYNDETSKSNSIDWEYKIKSICYNIPVVFWENKLKNQNIIDDSKEPILLLARKITGRHDLELIK